ncbi:MAG: hypothetical protein R2877_03240 [Bdellovibrionota bacterium]
MIQINGKKRGSVLVAPESSQAQVEAAARAEESVLRHLEGVQVVKMIYVPGRLFSFVVKN